MTDPAALVGRDAEVAAAQAFVTGADAVALVLEGEPGIGKTALCGAALAAAGTGVAVCASRPAQAEASFSYAALADLLSGVDGAVVTALPEPQRRALDVALLRREAAEGPLEAHAVAAGFLSALRALAAGGGVLVAIDDLQWIDAASGIAVEFALRRIEPGEGIRLLCSRRPGPGAAADLLSSLLPRRLQRIELDPLDPEAIQQLLSSRLD